MKDNDDSEVFLFYSFWIVVKLK